MTLSNIVYISKLDSRGRSDEPPDRTHQTISAPTNHRSDNRCTGSGRLIAKTASKRPLRSVSVVLHVNERRGTDVYGRAVRAAEVVMVDDVRLCTVGFRLCLRRSKTDTDGLIPSTDICRPVRPSRGCSRIFTARCTIPRYG